MLMSFHTMESEEAAKASVWSINFKLNKENSKRVKLALKRGTQFQIRKTRQHYNRTKPSNIGKSNASKCTTNTRKLIR